MTRIVHIEHPDRSPRTVDLDTAPTAGPWCRPLDGRCIHEEHPAGCERDTRARIAEQAASSNSEGPER